MPFEAKSCCRYSMDLADRGTLVAAESGSFEVDIY